MLACKEVRLKAVAYRRCLAMARLQPLPPEDDDGAWRGDGRRGRKRKSKPGARVSPERSVSPEGGGEGDGSAAAPRAAPRGAHGASSGGAGTGLTADLEDLMQRWAVEIRPNGSDKVRVTSSPRMVRFRDLSGLFIAGAGHPPFMGLQKCAENR